jgi:predicted RNA-binding Zn-ribbon protein involved in translation (DUF1610 family)
MTDQDELPGMQGQRPTCPRCGKPLIRTWRTIRPRVTRVEWHCRDCIDMAITPVITETIHRRPGGRSGEVR